MVGQLHLERISIFPDKANPPAARDAYAVLSIAVSPELLKPVAWRHPEVIDACRIVDPIQLASRPFHERERERSISHAVEDIRGALVRERPDHVIPITIDVTLRKCKGVAYAHLVDAAVDRGRCESNKSRAWAATPPKETGEGLTVKQEIKLIYEAMKATDEEFLARHGGFVEAGRRSVELQRLPEAKLTEGVSIDDYSTWLATRFADPDEIG